MQPRESALPIEHGELLQERGAFGPRRSLTIGNPLGGDYRLLRLDLLENRDRLVVHSLAVIGLAGGEEEARPIEELRLLVVLPQEANSEKKKNQVDAGPTIPAWMAAVRETDQLKPIDKAVRGTG